MLCRDAGRVVGLVAFMFTLVLLVAGCGGNSSSSGGATSAAGRDTSEVSGSLEPSKEFNDPEGIRGIEPVATFGSESDQTEREAASRVLSESFTAREEADFAGQCATLGPRGLKAVFRGEEGKADPARCKSALEKIASPLSKSESVRANTLAGEIAALRVKGDEAFALYHGNDGNDWAVPMEKEGGQWKVGSLIAIELPKTPPPAAKQGDGKKKSQGKKQSGSKSETNEGA